MGKAGLRKPRKCAEVLSSSQNPDSEADGPVYYILGGWGRLPEEPRPLQVVWGVLLRHDPAWSLGWHIGTGILGDTQIVWEG